MRNTTSSTLDEDQEPRIESAAIADVVANGNSHAVGFELDATVVGERIKMLRKGLGLTQLQLAEAAGTTAQNISNYERGEYKPDLEAAFALARALKVSIEGLLGYASTTVSGPMPYTIPADLPAAGTISNTSPQYWKDVSGTVVLREDAGWGMPPGLADWAARRTLNGTPVSREHLATMARIALRHGTLESWDKAYEAVLLDEKAGAEPPTPEEATAGGAARAAGIRPLPKKKKK